MQQIGEKKLAAFKWAYTTRNVDRGVVKTLLPLERSPVAGDLVLARVLRLGHHRKLELVTSRRASIFEGDEIVVVFGNRYAPDQFEGVVPDTLSRPCHLVAAGGVAARELNRHVRAKRATKIQPLGLLGDEAGTVVNLSRFALAEPGPGKSRPMIVAVAGSSMNSGKTTACSSLVKGMVRLGYKVGAAKVTGTGAGADYRSLVDAGAEPVYDFVDAGHVSTYLADEDSLNTISRVLIGNLVNSGVDVIVLEVADGLLQQETSRLLGGGDFRELIDGMLFAANDALGAQAGVAWLGARLLPVIGVTGVLTSSPLAVREAGEATALPVYPTDSLAYRSVARLVYDCLQSRNRSTAEGPGDGGK